jgi:hypothetical protein
MTQDADGSAPMLGSQEPAAWAAFADDSGDSGVTALNREAVDEVAARMGWKSVPLYRAPALTDRERGAIGVAIQCVEAARAQRHPEDESRDLLWETTCTLRRLFDRTT